MVVGQRLQEYTQQQQTRHPTNPNPAQLVAQFLSYCIPLGSGARPPTENPGSPARSSGPTRQRPQFGSCARGARVDPSRTWWAGPLAAQQTRHEAVACSSAPPRSGPTRALDPHVIDTFWIWVEASRMWRSTWAWGPVGGAGPRVVGAHRHPTPIL
jgi:hypothetical protein